jgi:hypothetical protein
MKKTFYVVEYNSGTKQLKVIVESHEDFLNWLQKHNEAKRTAFIDNNDTEAEFNLIPLELFI